MSSSETAAVRAARSTHVTGPMKGLDLGNWRRATQAVIARLKAQIEGAEAERTRRYAVAEAKVRDLKAWVAEPMAELPAKRDLLARLEASLAAVGGTSPTPAAPVSPAQPVALPAISDDETLRKPGIVSDDRRKQWSRMYTACRKCQRTSVKHAAHGYCANCYPSIVRDNA